MEMGLLRQISNWWQDQRINWAYRHHRAKLLETHRAEAETRYPVAQKRADIDTVHAQASCSAANLYGDPLRSMERRLSQTRTAVKERSRQLALVQEDIEPKVSKAIRAKEAKQLEKTELLRQKHVIDQDLNAAYSAVHSWHDDSRDWLGTRGRDIPQWSFFGQSWSQLDDLKDAVGEAKGDSLAKSEAIGRVIGQILDLEDEINILKAKRLEKRAIAKQGMTVATLQRSIDLLVSDINELEAQYAALTAQSKHHVTEFEADAGLQDAQDALSTIIEEKQRFLDAFEDDSAEQARRESHRGEWLRAKAFSRTQP